QGGGAGGAPSQGCGAGGGVRDLQALQGGPGEQQALLAGVAEADESLGLVALALEADDHALAELGVGDVVADPEAELLGAGGPGHGASGAGGADDAGAELTLPGGAPTGMPATRQLDQLLRDLAQEPAGRVVLRRAEQVPAPGVAQVQPLPGPGDAHVAEAALLVE